MDFHSAPSHSSQSCTYPMVRCKAKKSLPENIDRQLVISNVDMSMNVGHKECPYISV